ncbi:hypothetical protein C9J41_12020 [Photobacterium sp. GB-50]|uniref:hypothetical protein n=1 Tax=unclassified Photobacterium TaxID=2628852 RepID=UPI000D167BD6|nr:MULTISPECIES: hypothetical protein [unclassified Photobacterium]PSV57135.1 hypothetical protein C9J43_08130 [Photobacterium sp. GB-3]PSW73221.1 hypothetical protein C9J41_12020 [Photobacterium sp. GB-50]
MLQIAMLLFGAPFVKSKIFHLLGFSTLWGFAGLLIFIDGLDGKVFDSFSYFLLLESLTTLIVAPSGLGLHRNILIFKGLIFLCCAIAALVNIKFSNILLSATFGLTYISVGIFNIASAWVVRFAHWKRAIVWGCIQIFYSIFLLQNYNYVISYFLGFIMITGSIRSIIVLMKVSSLKYNSPIFQLLNNSGNEYISTTDSVYSINSTENRNNTQPLTIHIWTPEGSAENPHVPRPIINRYIAATDVNGVISTGHAALEAGFECYISLYPSEDIDRSPSEFIRTLKATPENNVLGRYLPDYKTEAAEWCESNVKIEFIQYNALTLKQFWHHCYKNPIYNLTSNNCSSNTAYALEAALDGVLYKKSSSIFTLLKLLCSPELWLAAQIRHRAMMMAWTPGLTMDYSRVLHSIVQPASFPWYQRLSLKYSLQQAIRRTQNNLASNFYD